MGRGRLPAWLGPKGLPWECDSPLPHAGSHTRRGQEQEAGVSPVIPLYQQHARCLLSALTCSQGPHPPRLNPWSVYKRRSVRQGGAAGRVGTANLPHSGHKLGTNLRGCLEWVPGERAHTRRGGGRRNRRQSSGVQSHMLSAANRAQRPFPAWGSDPQSSSVSWGTSPHFLRPWAPSPTRHTRQTGCAEGTAALWGRGRG